MGWNQKEVAKARWRCCSGGCMDGTLGTI